MRPLNKYNQIVADYFAGKIRLPVYFYKFYRTHKRKVRTMIDCPRPCALMVFERN